MPYSVPSGLLGVVVAGDIGDYTLYTNKNGRIVTFPKDWRQEKTSVLRIRCRVRFRLAQQSWAALTTVQKQSLEEACRVLSMPLTGQNLWISTAMRGDHAAYATVEQQSGIALPPPPDQVPADV